MILAGQPKEGLGTWGLEQNRATTNDNPAPLRARFTGAVNWELRHFFRVPKDAEKYCKDAGLTGDPIERVRRPMLEGRCHPPVCDTRDAVLSAKASGMFKPDGASSMNLVRPKVRLHRHRKCCFGYRPMAGMQRRPNRLWGFTTSRVTVAGEPMEPFAAWKPVHVLQTERHPRTAGP